MPITSASGATAILMSFKNCSFIIPLSNHLFLKAFRVAVVKGVITIAEPSKNVAVEKAQCGLRQPPLLREVPER